MVSKTQNMHGKIYTLVDEVERTETKAKELAQQIRYSGKVAYLSPRVRKNKETIYYVFEAEKTARISRKKSISINELIQELHKGKENLFTFVKELEKVQLENLKTDEKIIPKKTTPKKTTPKKTIPKKNNKKK